MKPCPSDLNNFQTISLDLASVRNMISTIYFKFSLHLWSSFDFSKVLWTFSELLKSFCSFPEANETTFKFIKLLKFPKCSKNFRNFPYVQRCAVGWKSIYSDYSDLKLTDSHSNSSISTLSLRFFYCDSN